MLFGLNYKFINNQIQMHKNKYYRAPKPSTLPQKHSSRPKPEWTTDFEDRDKYKLSEGEMIQRKAALQSKNREIARQDLEERRKKLEMGIIDEDTKKVYETALTSKKIDLNPSVRKNLSQMIQYEREAQKKVGGKHHREVENSEEEDGGENFDEEIKKTGNFIKKLEKAKKEDNIQRAIGILTQEKKSSHFGPTKRSEQTSQNVLTLLKQSQIKQEENYSCEQTLSNIEQTIKYMEQKLFNPNWKKEKEQEKEKKKTLEFPGKEQQKKKREQGDFKKKPMNNFLTDEKEISYNEFLADQPQNSSRFKTDLQINFNHNIGQEEQEQDCLDTIRRMREMIESKADLYCPESSKEKENQNSYNGHFKGFSTIEKLSEDEPSVDFSLTMNEDDCSFKADEPLKKQKSSKEMHRQSSYQELKKNLFDEVQKLEKLTFERQEEPSEISDSFSYQYRPSKESKDSKEQDDDQKSHQVVPQPISKKKKPKNSLMNSEFEQIKSLIEGSKTNVQRIQVEPIGISKGNMTGFDYRGSINIKKNVKQPQY